MKSSHKFILLILIAFVLNIIWEFLHYQLYIDLSGISSTPHLILASFTDMIIIFCIFSFISIIYHSLTWINKPTLTHYIIIIILSLIVAIFIEVVNLNAGRWEYTPAMPILFGIGLSPLIQLAVTSILSLKIVKLFSS